MSLAYNDRVVAITASGGQTVFTSDYSLFGANEVLVTKYTAATGITTTLALTTDYTITEQAISTYPKTFTITLVSAAAVNDIITLEGNRAIKSDAAFSIGGAFDATEINLNFDKLAAEMQEMATDVAASDTGSGTSGTIPLWLTTNTLGDSIASQSGTTFTVTGSLNQTSSGSVGITSTSTSPGFAWNETDASANEKLWGLVANAGVMGFYASKDDGSATTIILSATRSAQTVQTVTLGGTTVAVTNNATVGGTLGVTGAVTLTTKLALTNLAQTAAAANDVMAWSGSAWAPSTIVSSRWQNGSAGTPSYGFTNDIDTGIYLDSDGVLGISTAGVARVLVSSTGVSVTGAISATTTIAATGNISGANLSGTNTGDQTITLTGNVTGSGTGSFAATIAAGVVTNAMLAGSIDLAAKVTGLLPLANGGSAANLTANMGGIVYSGASAMAILAGTATANKMLMSGSTAAPTWSVPTFPNASATSGKIIISDGTNWTASTPTFSTTATSGAYLRADGTNWITSTLILPNAATVNQVVYASSSNTYGGSANLTFNGTTLALTGAATISTTLNVTGISTLTGGLLYGNATSLSWLQGGATVTGLASVNTDTANVVGLTVSNHNSGASAARIAFLKGRTSYASPTIASDSDQVMHLGSWAHDGTDYKRIAILLTSVDGTPAAGDTPGRFIFQTTPAGSTTPVERMRITSAGLVGIGGVPNASALLDLQSTTTGFGAPSMTTTQKNAISSPRSGLVVYDSTLGKLCVRGAAAWETITSV